MLQAPGSLRSARWSPKTKVWFQSFRGQEQNKRRYYNVRRQDFSLQGLRQGVCLACRDARKNGVRPANNGERKMYDAVCASCGKACKVPFQPREDRPVYCSDCFARIKQN